MNHILSPKGKTRGVGRGGLLVALLLMAGLTLAGLPALPTQAAANIALATTSLQSGQVPVVSGIGFFKSEKIVFWLTAPDRSVQAYGYTYSDDTGVFKDFSYPAASNFTQQTGFWYVTAQGLSVDRQAIASFTVGQVTTPTPPPNSNPPAPTPAPAVTPPPPVEVAPDAPILGLAKNILRMDELLVINATGYAPGERVDFWLTGPDSAARTYGTIVASPSGTINGFSNAPTPLGNESKAAANARATGQFGLWYISGRGMVSGKTGISDFVIAPPTLAASITGVAGNLTTLSYSGTNFFALETVSMWLTDAYGHVTSLGSTLARADGGVPSLVDSGGNLITTLSFLTDGLTGPYVMTAQGGSSHFIITTVLANPVS